MSRENVELARRGMNGVEEFFALFDEFVICDNRFFSLPDSSGVEVGRDAVTDLCRRYWEAFDDYRLTAEEIIDAGPSVVLVLREEGRGKESGVPFEREWAHVWTFRNGRIIRIEPFPSRAEALEAAGLSE